jgi:hypothetical protein
MTRLRESVLVESPAEQGVARLDQFFTSLRGSDGTARIRLRVPSDGVAQELSIDREVHVEARRAGGESPLDDLLVIRWSPEGTAVFPTFEGTLIVRENGEAAKCWMELDGNYTPPLGSDGQVFDAAIGQRIARATARELLNDLKREIEKTP